MSETMSETVLEIVVDVIGILYTITFTHSGNIAAVVREGKTLPQNNIMVKKFEKNKTELIKNVPCGFNIISNSLVDV